jgi:hypothetical protein
MKLLLAICLLSGMAGAPLSPTTRQYTVPLTQWVAVQTAAKAQGWAINSTKGTFTNFDVILSYTYAAPTLTFTILAKPVYVDADAVWGNVVTWVWPAVPTATLIKERECFLT